MTTSVTRIGNTVVITGEITAGEDVVIDGTVHGQVTVPEQMLTVGPAGRVEADMVAKTMRVMGKVSGTMRAATRVDIERMAVIDGELVSPVVTMADGATFNGTLNTRPSAAAESVAKYRRERANTPAISS
jgi:cytoskeletal protein CcmA (bactofilin family)